MIRAYRRVFRLGGRRKIGRSGWRPVRSSFCSDQKSANHRLRKPRTTLLLFSCFYTSPDWSFSLSFWVIFRGSKRAHQIFRVFCLWSKLWICCKSYVGIRGLYPSSIELFQLESLLVRIHYQQLETPPSESYQNRYMAFWASALFSSRLSKYRSTFLKMIL